jgi:hypothetical protein
MKYMLLIYQDEPSWDALSEAERQQIYLEYRKLRDELQTRGQFVTGSQLQPIATATSVRVRDGKELVTDGPFAETHEQLGGYSNRSKEPRRSYEHRRSHSIRASRDNRGASSRGNGGRGVRVNQTQRHPQDT